MATVRLAGRLPGLALLAAVLATWLLAGTGDWPYAPRLVAAAAAASAGVLLVRRIRGGPAAAGGARGGPDEFEVVWWRAAEAAALPDPPERDRLRRLVRLALSDADHAHRRLRPLLRDVADARAEAAYGVHLDRDPDAAGRLGPVAWSWLRPDRPEPADRHGRGPDLDELDAVVTAVERLGHGGEEPPS